MVPAGALLLMLVCGARPVTGPDDGRKISMAGIVPTLASLGAAVGLLAGCGGTDGGTGGSAASVAPSTTSVAVSAPTGDAAVPNRLNLTAKTIGGEQFSGATLAGKPAVLWFWTPWCPTCQREAPGIAKVARANAAVTFVGVAAQDQPPVMQEFVDKYDVGFFTNIADVDGAVWQRFGVVAQPAFAFVRKDGSVDVVPGSLSESELAERVEALART